MLIFELFGKVKNLLQLNKRHIIFILVLLLPGEKLCLHTRQEECGVPKTNCQSLGKL